MKKKQTTKKNEDRPPEPAKNPDQPKVKRHFCPDRSGSLHWGNTPEEAMLDAAQANREMGNFDPS